MGLEPIEGKRGARLIYLLVGILALAGVISTTERAAAGRQTPTGGTPISAPCLELSEQASPAADAHGHVTGESGAVASPVSSPMSTPAAALPPFDLAFIDAMVPHHEGAVAMSEVALNRVEHPELRDLALRIIDAQRAEQAQMAGWRDAWFPGAPALDVTVAMSVFDAAKAELGMPADSGEGHGMDPVADALAMCQAAAPIDLAFLDRMVLHHQSAITMAEVALQFAEHAELRDLAQGIIDSQRAEIDQMLIWREQWV